MTVFLTYDQAELDRQYNHQAWVPSAAEIIRRYGQESEAVRSRVGEPACLAYGPSAAETLDLYRVADERRPVHVFIHGGAWRNLGKRESAFPAETFLRAGAHFAAIDFALLPAVTLDQMADQVRRAIAWLYRHAEEIGVDRDRIYVSGHSSGAHLCALAAETAWADYDCPDGIIKGAVCISGIYDLKPVRLSARNDYVRLDHRLEFALSPILHTNRLGCDVIVGFGDRESDEFQRQAKEFARVAGRRATLIECAGLNHFETAETLSDPRHAISLAALRQMQG